MTLESLSFGLAVLLGLIAFGLMKHTADEFDKWYEDQANGMRLRIPAAAFSVLVIALIGTAFLLSR